MPFSIPMKRTWTSLPGMPTVRHRVILLPCPRTHPYLTFLFSAMRLQVLAGFH